MRVASLEGKTFINKFKAKTAGQRQESEYMHITGCHLSFSQISSAFGALLLHQSQNRNVVGSPPQNTIRGNYNHLNRGEYGRYDMSYKKIFNLISEISQVTSFTEFKDIKTSKLLHK